jgi:hypothetical protein
METVHEAPRARVCLTAVAPGLVGGSTTGAIASVTHAVSTVPKPGMPRPSSSHGQSVHITCNAPCPHHSRSISSRQRCRPATATQSPSQQVQQPQQHSTSTEHSALLRAWDQRIRSRTQRPASAPSSASGSLLPHQQSSSQHRSPTEAMNWLLHPSSLCSTSSRLQEQLMRRTAGLTYHAHRNLQEGSHHGPAARLAPPIPLRGLVSASLTGTAAAGTTVMAAACSRQ